MIDPRTRYMVNNQGMIKETPLNDECKFFTDPEIKVTQFLLFATHVFLRLKEVLSGSQTIYGGRA